MQDIIQQLGPNESVNAPIAGSIIAYKDEADSQPFDVIVNGATRRLNVGDVSQLPVTQGNRIRIYNPNNQTIHCRYFIGDDMYYAAQVAGNVSVSGGVDINNTPLSVTSKVKNWSTTELSASGIQTVSDVQPYSIPSNASRRKLTLQTNPGNGGTIFLGDNNNNRFAWLDAGGSFTMESTAALNVITDNGSVQQFAYVEEI